MREARRWKRSGARISSGQTKELRLILKTDVQGSVAAVRQALEQTEHVTRSADTPDPLPARVRSPRATCYSQWRPTPSSSGSTSVRTRERKRLADQDNVQIRRYDIIYRLTEDVEKALHGLLEPTIQDVTEGTAEVRAVFSLGRSRKSAGCYVTDGTAHPWR